MGVNFLAAVDPAATVETDDGGQRSFGACRAVDIQQIFRVRAVGQIFKALHILRQGQSLVPDSIAPGEIFTDLRDCSSHSDHPLCKPVFIIVCLERKVNDPCQFPVEIMEAFGNRRFFA